jgi:hypothetical protein
VSNRGVPREDGTSQSYDAEPGRHPPEIVGAVQEARRASHLYLTATVIAQAKGSKTWVTMGMVSI